MSEQALSQAEPKKRSHGQRLFDFIIYGPVYFFGTLILTVDLAYRLQYKGGRKMVESAAQKLADWGMSLKTADNVINPILLHVGGLVMIAPVKLAESFKIPIIQWLDHGKQDGADVEAIKAEPKQTWGSLVQARIAAWLSVWAGLSIAGHFFHKTFEDYIHWTGETTAKLFKQPTHRESSEFQPLLTQRTALKDRLEAGGLSKELLRSTQKELMQVGDKIRSFETKPYAYGKILSLDIFATVASTALLYVGSRFFARRHEEKIERKEARMEQAAIPSPPAPASPTPKRDEQPRAQVQADSVTAQKAAAPQVTLGV